MTLKKIGIVAMSLPLLVSCNSKLSSLSLVKLDQSSVTTAGVWVQSDLIRQMKSSEGVVRCGEILQPFPEALSITNTGEVAMIAIDDALDQTPVGQMHAGHEPQTFAVQGTKQAWSMAIDHNQLKMVHNGGSAETTTTYERSSKPEAELALIENAKCLNRLMASVERGVEPYDELDRQNRAVLARNRIQLAMANASAVEKEDTVLMAVFGAGAVGAAWAYDKTVDAGTELVKRQRIAKNALARAERGLQGVQHEPNVSAIERGAVPSENMTLDRKLVNKVTRAQAKVAQNNRAIFKNQAGRYGLAIAAVAATGAFLYSVLDFATSESPKAYVSARPELQVLMAMSNAEFRNAVEGDPAQGDLVTEAYQELMN